MLPGMGLLLKRSSPVSLINTCILLLAIFCNIIHAATPGPNLVAGSRPNIVVIVADDLDNNLFNTAVDAGFLPTIKRLFIDNGIEFSSSYVTNSVCCPSRATFLTGQYTHNHGKNHRLSTFNDTSTIATWLSTAGYYTGFVGKYLNGYNGTYDANNDGEIDPTETKYVPPGWDDWQALIDWTTYQAYDYQLLNSRANEIELYPSTYRTYTLARKTVEFIQIAKTTNDAMPFFLWLNPVVPHTEKGVNFDPTCYLDSGQVLYTIRPAPQHEGSADSISMPLSPSFNEVDIADKPAWLQSMSPTQLGADNVACIESVYQDKLESLRVLDQLVSVLVRTLSRQGETDTVLIFTSDNGFIYGEHRLIKKTYAYEESIRVPMFVRDLSTISRGSVTQPVLNNDLAPTIAELAGATIELEIDGRSFLPLLDQPVSVEWRKRFFVEHYEKEPVPDYVAVREVSTESFLYVEYRLADDPGGGWLGCITDQCEYYDLISDEPQLINQYASPGQQTKIQQLEELANDFRTCAGTTCRALEDMTY